MTAATRVAAMPREGLQRLALKLDAVVTGANGAIYLIAANPLHDLLGPSPTLTRSIGAFLLLFAVGVWVVATRPEVPRAGMTAVIEANVLWVAASIGFVVAGLSDLTTVGTVWALMQAATVAGFAALQGYARA